MSQPLTNRVGRDELGHLPYDQQMKMARVESPEATRRRRTSVIEQQLRKIGGELNYLRAYADQLSFDAGNVAPVTDALYFAATQLGWGYLSIDGGLIFKAADGAWTQVETLNSSIAAWPYNQSGFFATNDIFFENGQALASHHILLPHGYDFALSLRAEIKISGANQEDFVHYALAWNDNPNYFSRHQSRNWYVNLDAVGSPSERTHRLNFDTVVPMGSWPKGPWESLSLMCQAEKATTAYTHQTLRAEWKVTRYGVREEGVWPNPDIPYGQIPG